MTDKHHQIRNAKYKEFKAIGELMVTVYSQLPGFPKASDQPDYYHLLANIGELTKQPGTELLVAISRQGDIAGAVVYFDDMHYYGSGGSASMEKDAAGFRLLAVNPEARGQGIGKLLSQECINKAIEASHSQIIIHSTRFMKIAWKMYENLGFTKSADLDFVQGNVQVYGFRLYFDGRTIH